jgi:CRP-like cAMP-binding protein
MIVIVTHQLGLAQIADRIVVMSAGRIVESGSYDNLLAAGGHFARLHELGGGALGRPRHVDGLAELLADDNVAVTTRRFADGDIVFHEGDPADIAYVIRSGAATVSTASDGSELELGLMGRGELIGELGVLSDGVRSATVRAVGDTVLVEIPPDELRDLMASPANAAELGSQVVNRLLRDRQAALARYARGGRTP